MTDDKGCMLEMTVSLGRHAKGYAVFRYWPGESERLAGLSMLSSGQTVDGLHGWYTAYVAVDSRHIDHGAVETDAWDWEYDDGWKYADLPVYGGCTYAGPGIPGLDLSGDFPEGCAVYGWDYNHGYTRDWTEYEESEIDLSDIVRDIMHAWFDVLRNAVTDGPEER